MRLLRAAWPLLLLAVIGTLLLASGMSRYVQPERLLQSRDFLLGEIAAAPLLSALVFILLMTLAIATAVPGAVLLVLAGGMLFGAWTGTALSVLGVLAGGSILFAASRHSFRQGTATPPPLALRLRERYQANPFSYTMFLRLLPLFPFGAVTVALAWMRCSWTVFLASCLLGSALMLGLQSHLGAGLVDSFARSGTISLRLFGDPQVAGALLGMALLALVPAVIATRRRNRGGDGPA